MLNNIYDPLDYWPMLKPVVHTWFDYASMSSREILIATVQASVNEWIEKYHPRDEFSNLRVTDPENRDQLIHWREWVMGRIKHQFLWSWFWKLTDKELSIIIAIAMHEYLWDDAWYTTYLLAILPSCIE